MKKLKLFAVALLAAFSLGAWADATITLGDVTPTSNWYEVEGVGRVANKSGNAFSSPDLTCEGSTGFKTGSSYFTIQTYQAITAITVAARSSSNRTISKFYVSEELGSGAPSASNMNYVRTGGTESYDIPKNTCDNEFTLTFESTVAANSYMQIVLSGNADIVAVTFVGGGSTPPEPQCTAADATFAAASTDLIIAENAESATTTLTFTPGDNTSAVVYTVLKGGQATTDASVVNGVFTATVRGTYTVKATQAADATYCEVVKEVTITVADNRPVCGELIKAVHSGKTTATVSGVVGGTVDKSTQDNGKLGSNGHYFGVKLAEGNFLEDDEVVFVAEALNGGNTATIYSDKGNTLLGTADFDTETNTATFTLTATTEWVYLYRTSSGCNPTINYISVNRTCDDGSTVLNVNPAEVALNVTAEHPSVEKVVTFSGKHLAAGTYNLTVPSVDGLTVAPTSVNVGEDGKLKAAVTLTYTTNTDVAAAQAVLGLTIGQLTKQVTINYSAVQAKAYMASVNIEQLVLDNGTKFNIKAHLDTKNIVYANVDVLDSLNDEKTNRNYPFLGLKLKKTDASLSGWLQQGSTVKMRLGNVGADFKIIVAGQEQTLTNAYANATVEDNNVLEFTATEADVYMQIICNSTKTLVVKQIMINENIAAVTLPASPQQPTALDNLGVEGKAVKVVIDGQLYILKNGVRYNALGAVVK